MKIGFVGLGNMGMPMALNLARAGHEVHGFDAVVVAQSPLHAARSAKDAVKGADVVITMLPNGDILREVADQIIPAMTSGAVLCDCSTVDIQTARDVCRIAERSGIGMLDAPVSGGTVGAEEGRLTFMIGGTDETFAKVAALFEIMGAKVVHCGGPGAGQAAKICNNMILGITMIATCEAFGLADRVGLDRQKLFDVVSTSSGNSWSLNNYCPAPGVGPESPADHDYTPGFAAELMLKDLNLSQMAAQGADARTPMGGLAAQLYDDFVTNGRGRGKDFSAILSEFLRGGTN